jgi:threonine dehydrogenase-like Zn-dependent dehydrogenase
MDKFPMGLLMNKGITLRTAQQHGHAYVPRLLEFMQKGQLDTKFLATHRIPLEDGVRGYDMFKHKTDDCMRVVFFP